MMSHKGRFHILIMCSHYLKLAITVLQDGEGKRLNMSQVIHQANPSLQFMKHEATTRYSILVGIFFPPSPTFKSCCTVHSAT